MKKTLLATLLCALSVAASAQLHQNVLRFGTNYRTPDFLTNLKPTPNEATAMPTPGDNNKSQAFGNLGSLTYGAPVFGYFMQNAVPMAYDRTTKNLYLLYNEQTAPSANAIGVNLKIYTASAASGYKSFSTTAKLMYTSSTDYSGMPQLAVMNPDNAKASTDSLYFLAMTRQYPQSTQYNFSGPTFFLKSGSGLADPYQVAGPDNNNAANYQFGAGSLVGFWNSTSESAIHAGVLDPPSSAAQYGQYGQIVFADVKGGSENSSLPTSWNNAQFKAAPAATNSYNGPMYCDAAPNGTCFAAINSIFTDDENSRVIAFSTSSDLGVSWSDFSKIPTSTFDAYATSVGLAKCIAIQVYQQDGFLVTGNNRFSFVFRAALYDGSDELQALHIVEADYNNGSWSMRKVADFSDVPYVFYAGNDSINSSMNYAKLKPIRLLNPLGNEIEVARTADGANLVIKWIDYNMTLGPTVLNPVLTVVDQNSQTGELSENPVDTVYSTDVFISTRAIGSSTWSTPKNLTNDKAYDYGTHMPRTVPALEQIPIISNRTMDKSKFTSGSQTANMLKATPNDVLSRCYNVSANVGYGLFSAQVDVPSEEAAAAAGIHLSAPVPSPANDYAEISYTTAQAGKVTVSLSNVLGEKVATVFDGSVDAGVHGFYVNTANLVSGAYLVSMNINGYSVSKTMVISH